MTIKAPPLFTAHFWLCVFWSLFFTDDELNHCQLFFASTFRASLIVGKMAGVKLKVTATVLTPAKGAVRLRSGTAQRFFPTNWEAQCGRNISDRTGRPSRPNCRIRLTPFHQCPVTVDN